MKCNGDFACLNQVCLFVMIEYKEIDDFTARFMLNRAQKNSNGGRRWVLLVNKTSTGSMETHFSDNFSMCYVLTLANPDRKLSSAV